MNSKISNITKLDSNKVLAEKELIRIVDEMQLENINVLELGCWDGRNTLYLAKKGYNVLSVDISNQLLKEVKDKAIRLGLDKNINFTKKDLKNLKLEKDNFDLAICCVYIFHEIGKKAVKCIIDEIKKYLNVGGLVYFSFFTIKDGTRIEDEKYYPSKEEIVDIFGDGWEIYKSKMEILEHKHSVGKQKKNMRHRHAICHLFIKNTTV